MSPAPFVAPVEEEPDLDYGEDLTLDPAYEGPQLFDRGTSEPPPGSGNFDWASIREGLIRHRQAKGVGEDGRKVARTRVESDDPAIGIRVAGHEIAIEDLPQSPRGIAKRALAAGWQVHAVASSTHYAAVLYQDDSKGGDESEEERHARGDVRYPAEDREHWTVHARLGYEGRTVAGFRIRYETRPAKSTKAGIATKFECADCLEPGDRWFTLAAMTFGDWFDILVPPAEARAPRKSLEEKRDNKLAAPLETGEWNG